MSIAPHAGDADFQALWRGLRKRKFRKRRGADAREESLGESPTIHEHALFFF
jgi:hypothetical protein